MTIVFLFAYMPVKVGFGSGRQFEMLKPIFELLGSGNVRHLSVSIVNCQQFALI